MLAFFPIAGSPLSSLPVVVPAGDSIEGTTGLTFALSQPELVFQLQGTASLSFNATANLTINIELTGQATLSLAAQPANLTIGYQLDGTVTEMGIPVQRTIRAYDAESGELVDQTQSDGGTGEYFIDLLGHGADVFVQCLGSAAYGPLIHGPITPDRR